MILRKFMMLVSLMITGIAMADDCQHITDSESKAMCNAVAKSNTSYCYDIRDRDTKTLCMALASGNSSYCNDMSSSNNRAICQSKFQLAIQAHWQYNSFIVVNDTEGIANELSQ